MAVFFDVKKQKGTWHALERRASYLVGVIRKWWQSIQQGLDFLISPKNNSRSRISTGYTVEKAVFVVHDYLLLMTIDIFIILNRYYTHFIKIVWTSRVAKSSQWFCWKAHVEHAFSWSQKSNAKKPLIHFVAAKCAAAASFVGFKAAAAAKCAAAASFVGFKAAAAAKRQLKCATYCYEN